MEFIDPPSWGPPAAYLYTLKLDEASLAWEYLRRNPTYVSEFIFLSRMKQENILPTAWGLRRWEDPREDARSAEPDWIAAGNSEVTLSIGEVGDGGPRFDVWQLAGQHSLSHGTGDLRLTVRQGSEVRHRVRWPADLTRGDPISVPVTAGRGFAARARRAEALLRSFEQPYTDSVPVRPSTRAMTHMQTLQVLDGEAAGASHREIARRLFGFSARRHWDGDSRWRARVRYLIRCGRARVSRGPWPISVPGGGESGDAFRPSGCPKSRLLAGGSRPCGSISSIPRVLS